MKKKTNKPFFIEDSDGHLYKTVLLKDEDFALEEETVEEEATPEATDAEGEQITVVLSAEDFDILKQIIAERKEMHDADDKEKKEKEEEKKEEEVKDGCNDKEEKVVDTAKAKDSLNGFGSLENNKKVTDSADDLQAEIAAAWSKRYSGK